MGATFIGPDHDRMHTLSKEMGVTTFPTFVEGDNVLATGGRVRRYLGDIPRISPVALLSAAQAISRMNAMAEQVPVDAPWEAPKAPKWDAQSVRAWLSRTHVPTRLARDLIEATVRACFASDLSEVSLLNWLFLVRSAGSVEALMSIEGGYQHEQFDGGVQLIPNAMAVELGESVALSSPVSAVTQRDGVVDVQSSSTVVTARHVVLALPRALAAGIRFQPPLPADHALLIHQMPAGTELKTVAIYDEPFWRDEGISGATVATDDDVEVTLDTSQPGHSQGVMATYAAGPRAWKLARVSRQDRFAHVLDMLRHRLGPKAAAPRKSSNKIGPRSRGRGAARWGTSPPECSPSTAASCASPWGACTGPAPRRRPRPMAPWTEPCDRVSGRPKRFCSKRVRSLRPLPSGLSSLRPQHQRCRCAGGDTGRDGGDDVGQDQRAEGDQGHPQDRHRGLGHRVDLAGEQVPEPSPQNDADRDAEHDAHRGRDGRVPRHGGGQLALGEAQGLQQGEVATSSPDLRGQGQRQRGHRTQGKSRHEQCRHRADGAVVHDFRRALNALHDDGIADSGALGDRGKSLLAASAMRCRSAPLAAEMLGRSRTRARLGPLRVGYWLFDPSRPAGR